MSVLNQKSKPTSKTGAISSRLIKGRSVMKNIGQIKPQSPVENLEDTKPIQKALTATDKELLAACEEGNLDRVITTHLILGL